MYMDFYNYVGIKLAHEMLSRCKQLWYQNYTGIIYGSLYT